MRSNSRGKSRHLSQDAISEGLSPVCPCPRSDGCRCLQLRAATVAVVCGSAQRPLRLRLPLRLPLGLPLPLRLPLQLQLLVPLQ